MEKLKRNFFGTFFKVNLLNISLFFLFLFFLRNGYLNDIYLQDVSYISITLTIITFLTITYLSFFSYSVDMSRILIRQGNFETLHDRYIKFCVNKKENNSHLLYDNFMSKLYYSKEFTIIATMLGLLGTVIGFIIVLIYMDVELLKNFDSMKKLFEHISKGMGTALYTTLVGTISSIWVYLNYILLSKEIKNVCKEYDYIYDVKQKTEKKEIM